MPTPHHTPTEAGRSQPATKPASPRQLSYLRALAQRTGGTFAWPASTAHASREIRRLQAVRSTGFTFAELLAEQEAREAHGDVPLWDAPFVRPEEIEGYGSTATWALRS